MGKMNLFRALAVAILAAGSGRWLWQRRRPAMRLEGKLVLLTGASSGIGAALAEQLGAKGARVILVARDEGRLLAVAERVRRGGGQAHVYPVDLAQAESVTALAAEVMSLWGPPDVLVNNAGAGGWTFIAETTPAGWQEALAVPFQAAFYLSRLLVPAMAARGAGAVVNVTSPAAFVSIRGAAPYSVARWGMRALSQALEADLHGSGVRVLLAVPGQVDTSYFDHHPAARSRLPTIARLLPILSADQAAAGILSAVERGERLYVAPPLVRVLIWLHRLWSRPVERLAWATSPF